jgi:transcription initiation factor TFIIB
MRLHASGSTETEVSSTDRPERPSTTGTRDPPSPGGKRDRTRGCPNCGAAVESTERSELVCPECDVVVSDQPISTAPRPRYGSGEASTARSGSRVTFLYADRGLGVGIDEGVTTDGSGTPLSRTQRRVARDKPWTKHRTADEVRLDYGLGEIRRMGETVGVPSAERERAARLFRKVRKAGLVAGRSVDGFATVCLLVAVRQSGLPIPVSTRELESVSRADPDQIRAARGALEVHTDVEIPPMDPRDLLPKVASELSTPQGVRARARDLLDTRRADAKRTSRGVSPRTLVAAALHAAYDIEGCEERPTLSALSTATGVAGSTISDRKGLFVQYAEGQVS